MHSVVTRLNILILIALVVLASTLSVAAQDDGWTEFGFDSSSESYKIKGRRAFDLRSGRYATSEYARTHNGDFITMTGFNPEWVTFRTMKRGKILFSTSEENDAAVDQRAGQVSNCVPIHFGKSYVASFDERTYTIKLVEGGFTFPAGKAAFLYRPGGAPGPEYEPVRQAPTERSDHSERGDDTVFELTQRGPVADTLTRDNERIEKLTVTVKTGPPEDESDPQTGRMKLVLHQRYEGGDAMLSREALTLREGETRNFTFENVRPGAYEATVTYRGKTLEQGFIVSSNNTSATLAFPGAEEWERRWVTPDLPEETGICESRCEGVVESGARRPVDKRGSSEPVEGYVRFVYVCVATPAADSVSVGEAPLIVDLKGPKNFRLMRQKTLPGTTSTVKFLTFPVGTYEVVAQYAGETVSDTVELQGDCVDIGLAFPGAAQAEIRRNTREPEPIDRVTVTITTPPPADAGSVRIHSLRLSLNSISSGGFASMHRDSLAVRQGRVETYTFENVPPAVYSVTITYGGKTITDTVEISESNKDLEFVLK